MTYETEQARASSATGMDNPTLSFGLSGTADYGPGMQFLDLMKMMRPWIGHEAGKWGGMTIDQMRAGGYLDANGWVTEIPEGVHKVGTLWGWSGMTNQVDDHKGVYVLNYEGTGTFKIEGDVKILESTDGRIVFENTKGANMYLNIYATDPEKTGDYLRNFTMVAEKNLPLYEAGATFNPEWLDLVKDARELRFMDWMHTNNSKAVTWDDAPPASGPKSGLGVSVQDMVKLANELGVDPYFNMPHLADENYIRTFATYVRDNLDPALKVRVEYSNEVWNWAFQQAQSMLKQSQSEWGVNAHIDFLAKKATETALIWEDVFGDQADARVINVLATQTSTPWVANRLLNPIIWKQMEPDTYVDPSTVFEELAVTSYFGGAQTSDAVLRAKLIAAIKDPNIDATKYLAEQLMDPTIKGSIPNIAQKLSENAAIADKYGLKMTAYEGGQHVHHSFNVKGISTEDLNTLTEFMTGFVRSEQMGKLYSELWKVWADVSDGAFMQFGDIGLPSKYGSWGLYNDLDDANPRATAITELNKSSTPWWGAKGGTQYQQGVTVTGSDDDDLMVGTSQEDYLMGGKGDDIFVGGAGNDGFNGGEGIDKVILKGNSGEYTLHVEGKGYRISGLDGKDFMINVEQIAFDDDVAIVLADLTHNDDGSVTLPAPVVKPAPVVAGLNIEGTKRADILTGGAGNDKIEGYSGHDKINGGLGNDNLRGGNGRDIIYGDGGNDFIRGGTGSDRLFGGQGDDFLFGEKGNDYLTGGEGSDHFVFARGEGRDRVMDFGREDVLEFRDFFRAGQTLESAAFEKKGVLVISNGEDRITFEGLHLSDLSWMSIEI